MQNRSCGILLHISSLPSKYGIGDLGPSARDFAATLAASGLKYWQFLPLTPTSEFIGNSPYSSPSAFAGNALFISPEVLLEKGYISYADLDNACNLHCKGDNSGRVDYPAVARQREALLRAAFERSFAAVAASEDFMAFCDREAAWLDDYALFTAIKQTQDGKSWVDWPESLKRRDKKALDEAEGKLAREVSRQKFIQYLFFSQWKDLHSFCRELGLYLIGDLPIYVTHDSADVWANPSLFRLDDAGRPITVAGVPPDYFSETGQRWGNPVYRWDIMQRDGFAWWRKRLAHNLTQADIVRLDHFRGFCGYWEIPAEEKTAVNGAWVPGPGKDFFKAMQGYFGPDLPIIAEDLGVITDDVRELMREFALPGMKVLHFAFGGETPAQNPDAPFRHPQNSVVYTGTHDNTTTLDWFYAVPAQERKNLCNYAGRELSLSEALDYMLRLALSSPAALAVVPMQDVLGLGAEGRMNTPSVANGNWEWRLRSQDGWTGRREVLPASAFTPSRGKIPAVFRHLHELCRVYGRLDLEFTFEQTEN